MKNAAIILTFNESIHLERCVASIKDYFYKIYVIDSFSSDKTKEIARKLPVFFLENKFINHSQQFNWALTQIDKDTDWVLRIDADEYITKSLGSEIFSKLEKLDESIKGVFIPRQIVFQKKLIRFGGINPTKVLRLFRYGYGTCDSRWMDEHIKVNGKTIDFTHSIVDENLKPITWWIDKHNNYASKEAYELIIHKNIILNKKRNSNKLDHKKIDFYYEAPIILRSFLYFFYRYFINLGFLDGIKGFSFHFLQGLWYRLLVDIKYLEVMDKYKNKKNSLKEIIKETLLIDTE